ncbi:hypothetical protein [Mesorhizobium sp. M0047]|uniref:hypothetical protein n=1 Tax=Mesorhizobium sp. M0047 TaxID=2956859 RepID=UPI003339D737
MRKLALFLGGLVLLIALWATMTTSGQILTGRWSYTEETHLDRGTYFRLKVDVTYRGEPQHFDIVVGCNVRGIGYKDGSSTREVGLVPTVYGRRMSDGKGLVVRVPDACHGDTSADGRVPADFVPVMVVYDDAATLGFGMAYMVDEAYHSPHSLMSFSKASVEKATRAEFDAFRQNGQPNLVTREQYHSAQPRDVVEKMGLTKIYPAFGRSCWAYSRSLIPEGYRANVRKYWPAERPKYWMIPDYKSLAELRESIKEANFSRDDGGKLKGIGPWIGSEWPDYGMMHRSGSKPIGPASRSTVNTPAFYPFTSDVSEASWPRDPSKWISYISHLSPVNILNISMAETSNRGFAYCYQPPSFSSNAEAIDLLKKRIASLTIEDDPVWGAPTNWQMGVWLTGTLFEDDKFIYYHQQFYLESTGGDV